MLQWKQLDAYNYFTSGFVRIVEIWDLRNASECVILKALVNPSMKNPEKSSQRLGSDQEIWRNSGSPLYLHGWVSLLHDHYEIKFIMCMIFLLYQLR